MDYFVSALREHQELAIFLSLAVGFFVGRIRIGSFSLGTLVGTLLAGVLIGQLDIQVPALVKNVSDRRRRIDVAVGVAHGTPPGKVVDVLLGVARAHPQVLADPQPTAQFQAFGDSALLFALTPGQTASTSGRRPGAS